MLLELYQHHFHVRNSKFSSAITQKKKMAVWTQIDAAVSSSGQADREVTDVRKKWVDLKMAALKANSDRGWPETGEAVVRCHDRSRGAISAASRGMSICVSGR